MNEPRYRTTHQMQSEYRPAAKHMTGAEMMQRAREKGAELEAAGAELLKRGKSASEDPRTARIQNARIDASKLIRGLLKAT